MRRRLGELRPRVCARGRDARAQRVFAMERPEGESAEGLAKLPCGRRGAARVATSTTTTRERMTIATNRRRRDRHASRRRVVAVFTTTTKSDLPPNYPFPHSPRARLPSPARLPPFLNSHLRHQSRLNTSPVPIVANTRCPPNKIIFIHNSLRHNNLRHNPEFLTLLV